MSRIRFVAGSLITLFAIQGFALAATRDTVILKKGNARQQGQIVSDNDKGVSLKTGGGTLEWVRKDVKSVEYSDTPRSYLLGLTSFRNGRYQEAIGLFREALGQQHSPLLKQYILYYMALSNQKAKQYKAAREQFTVIARMGKDSRFMKESYKEIVEIYIVTKKIKNAEKVLESLMKKMKVRKSNMPAFIQYLWARIYETNGNWKKALNSYQIASRGDPQYAAVSRIAIARCSIGAKKYSDAVREARSVLKMSDIEMTDKAELYVLLGDAIVKSGGSLKDARFAYIPVVTTVIEGTPQVELRALKGAIYVYEKLGEDKDDKAIAAKISKLKSLLKRRFPRSN